MAREHRVITALGPTAVPVPATFGLCQDPDVNGQPFYVMDFVDGHIVRDAPAAEHDLDAKARRRAGESLADTRGTLHAVDVDAVGLGDFAKRDGYIERQLRRWFEQFRNSQVEGLDTATIVGAVHDRLAARVPPQVGTSIVHGDYRLDNTVLGGDGEVRAVLDWEICTLGDPLADVGLLMVYWTDPGDEGALLGVTPDDGPRVPRQRRDAGALCRRPRVATSSTSTSTWPSGTGSWPASCRVSTPATWGGRQRETARAWTTSAQRRLRLAEMALGALDAVRRGPRPRRCPCP